MNSNRTSTRIHPLPSAITLALLVAAFSPALAEERPAKPAASGNSKPYAEALSLDAISPPSTKGTNVRGKEKEKGFVVTPSHEDSVSVFLKQHHSELAKLLPKLKKGNRKEYDRAVRELFRTSESLTQLQQRDAHRYELELRLWQARSNVQLLSARLMMGGTDDVREKLRSALAEQFDAKEELLRDDRKSLVQRLEKLDKQLHKLGESRSQIIEQQWREVSKSKPGESQKSAAEKRPAPPAETPAVMPPEPSTEKRSPPKP